MTMNNQVRTRKLENFVQILGIWIIRSWKNEESEFNKNDVDILVTDETKKNETGEVELIDVHLLIYTCRE